MAEKRPTPASEEAGELAGNEICIVCKREAPEQAVMVDGNAVKAPGTFKMVGIGLPDPKEEATAAGFPGKSPQDFVAHPVCDACYAKSAPGHKLAFFKREQREMALYAAQRQVLQTDPVLPEQRAKQAQYLNNKAQG